ncbi:hypothetical protein ABG067_003521 [Albugo candida]
MCKQPEDVVEEDWINYFTEAITTDSFELGKMDEMMTKFKMDTRLIDAGSRMSRLRNQSYRVLEEEGLQHYVEQVDAKRIVNWMVEGGWTRCISLNMDTNKDLKKNPVAFNQWCLGQLRSFMEWELEATRVESIRNVAATKTRLSSAQQRRVPVQKQRTKEEEKGKRMLQSGPPRNRFQCLKCKSTDHSVRRCSRCAPGEAEALLRNRQNNREEYYAKAPNVKKAALLKEKGEFFATVDGIQNVCTLLDSGSD